MNIEPCFKILYIIDVPWEVSFVMGTHMYIFKAIANIAIYAQYTIQFLMVTS